MSVTPMPQRKPGRTGRADPDDAGPAQDAAAPAGVPITVDRVLGGPFGYALELLRACAIDTAGTTATGTPRKPANRPPLLFVHGAYTDAWCWAETFLPFFAANGFEVASVSLRGHGSSEGADIIDAWSLEHYVDDVVRTISHLGRDPVLVGASMGGLIVQRVMHRDAFRQSKRIPAAIMVSSIPPSGMLAPISRMAVGSPQALLSTVNVALSGRPSTSFVELLAHDPIHADDLDRYRAHTNRESMRALWECSWNPLPDYRGTRHPPDMPPMLALAGVHDRMVPADTVYEFRQRYGAEIRLYDAVGHVPMLERHWMRVAVDMAHWLHQLPSATT